MIRQAISCDICGAEKKQTNHWFVASEQAGELRVSGWSSRNRLRTGSKHLCGQTCLHKLLDEFLARSVAGRPAPEASANAPEDVDAIDSSVVSKACVAEESSARVLPSVAPPERIAPPAVLPMPARIMESPHPIVMPRREETAADAARRRRAEAWERERARELRVVDGRPN